MSADRSSLEVIPKPDVEVFLRFNSVSIQIEVTATGAAPVFLACIRTERPSAPETLICNPSLIIGMLIRQDRSAETIFHIKEKSAITRAETLIVMR